MVAPLARTSACAATGLASPTSRRSSSPSSRRSSPSAGPVLATPFQEATHHGIGVLPPGWERGRAHGAQRMMAIYLSGEGEIEASDGDVRRPSPGMMLLAEDTAGRGHRVRVLGDEPVTVVHIVLPDES